MHNTRFIAALLTGFVTLLGIAASAAAFGQAPGGDADWQRLHPEGEEFIVLMPKDAKFEEGPQAYHKMTVNTRLYLSAPQNGPLLAVASISGIKSNPAMYTEMQRTNSYVDAFKNWFFPKVRKDVPVTLTLVGDKALNGNPGREYRVAIGDLSGTARVFTTRRRFYAVVFLNPKKDEKLTEQFLSSFYLPEKSAEPPAANEAAAATPAAPGAPDNKGAGGSRRITDAAAEGSLASADANGGTGSGETTPDGKTKEHAPISGGVLNGKALYLPTPDYPSGSELAGTVQIQVTVDEQGSVISAKAVSGPQALQQACINAALLARFSPTSLSGQPVKVSGVITFKVTKP